MKLDLKFPNFGAYQCRLLKLDKLSIIKEWNRIEAIQTSPFHLKQLILDFVNNSDKKLDSKNIIKIIHELNLVEEILKEEFNKKISLENFLTFLNRNLDNNDLEKNSIIAAEIIYIKIIQYYKRPLVIEQLKILGEKYLNHIKNSYVKSKEIEILKDFLDSKLNVIDFFESKFYKKFFSKNGEYQDSDFKLDYMIVESSPLTYEVLKRCIELRVIETMKNNNHTISLKLKNLKNYLASLQCYSELEITNLYASILDNIHDFNFPEIWMKDMQAILGNINSEGSEIILKNWKNFSDSQRDKFRTWVTKGKLDDFFKRKINAPERYSFWEKYLLSIKNAIYFEDLNQAIILELDNHVVIEYGKIGNAAYVYSKDDISIKAIKFLENSSDSKSSKLMRLKNIKNPIPLQIGITSGWNHSGEWQYKFQDKLYKLGYTMKNSYRSR
ncbi:MAG: hypothetical protein KA384_06885 [Leptotrichiaceae bacterium]|nr:hypothetical protein [Leptotrichiaceae bacterium]